MRAALPLAALLAAPLGAEPCPAFRFFPPRDLAPATDLVRVADFSGDGRPDLLLLDRFSDTARFEVQQPDGRFLPTNTVPTSAFDALIGDLDGDGVAEGVLLQGDGPQLLRMRDGKAEPGPEPRPSSTPIGVHAAIADLDNDGRDELVALLTDRTVWVFRPDARGAFSGKRLFTIGFPATDDGLTFVVADVTGDGNADVVAATHGPFNYTAFQTWPVWVGDGHDGFTPGAGVWFGRTYSVAVADFNGDGRKDFVYSGTFTTITTHSNSGIALGTSEGMTSRFLQLASPFDVLLAGDFDGDGDSDVGVSIPRGGPTLLHRNDDHASSFPGVSEQVPMTSVAAVDMDGDGRVDLVGTDGRYVQLARNACGTSDLDAWLPAVISVTGENGTRFETELTLDNSGSTMQVEVRYVPSFGGGGGSTVLTLPTSGQRAFRPALDALADAGVPIPRGGDRGGTLAFRVVSGNRATLAVTARVTSSTASGHAGVGFRDLPLGTGFEGVAVVGWLRETGGDRSNLALLHLGGEDAGPITLAVRLRGADGTETRLPDVRLEPGRFQQLNRVLRLAGLESGYALIERVEGSSPFFAYGIVNDERSGDGSYVPAFDGARRPESHFTIPAVVESGRYGTDVVLTNTTASARTLFLELVSEALTTEDRTARATFEVPARGQLFLSDFVDVLRRLGVVGVGARGGEIVGALFATLQGETSAGVYLGARVSAVKPEGRYGLFLEAFAGDPPLRTFAKIPAARQDAAVRTNVAIVNTGDAPITFDLYLDPPESPHPYQPPKTVVVGGRRWLQLDSVLLALGSAYPEARVTLSTRGIDARFLAYGVTNDGAVPGAGTDDGSLIPAR